MAVLASKDALGGNLGDTYGALKIVFVYADGVYAWGESDEISSGKFEVITDATTSLSSGFYRVGTLTADLTIASHDLAEDGEFVRIVDTYAITPSFKITLTLGGTVFYTDESGAQATATSIDIDSAFGDITLIKAGSDWHMDVDRATPPVRGLEHTKIDSSASATTETLAASSSENIVRLFVNDNVANTATLAVQSGETLNGVLNGTFAFSDYAQGMQFRADEVTGGWVIVPLFSEFDKPTYAATVSTGVAITPDYDVNQEFTLIFDGTSTGDIDFTNGSNSANLETSEKVRVSISNIDTVVRNLVLGSDYLKADGSSVGAVELPVGTTFRVLEFVRFGSNSFLLSHDSLESSADQNLVHASGVTLSAVMGTQLASGGTVQDFISRENYASIGWVYGDFTISDVLDLFPSLVDVTVFETEGTSVTYTTPANDAVAIPRGYYQLKYLSASNTLQVLEVIEDSNDLSSTKVDSSALPTTETLLASLNNGGVKLYTNIDVTNTATLAVQSGETLNGVTDGTFLFSNYAVGAQFRADEITGGWVVSVVGAGAQSSLVSESSATVINVSTSSTTPVDIISLTLPSDGKFILEAQSGWRTSASGSAHYFQIGDSSGNELGDSLLNGNGLVANQRQTISLSAEYEGDEGEVVNFQMYVSGGNTITVDNARFSYRQLPATESVLAGMVTPEPLQKYFVRGVAQDMSFPNDGINYLPVDLSSLTDGNDFISKELDSSSLRSGGTLTIKNTGEYFIHYQANHTQTNQGGTNGQNAFESFLTYRVNGGSLVVIGGETDTNEVDGELNGFERVEFASGDVVEFGVKADDNRQDEDYLIQIDMAQQPTSTVVMPDALEVEDLFQVLPVTDGSLVDNAWSDNPLGIGDLNSSTLQGSYLMLKWEVSGEDRWQRFQLPLRADIESHGPLLGSNVGFSIRVIASTGTGLDVLRVAHNSSGNSTLTDIVYYRPQKTVINTNDLTVTNPNEADTTTVLKPNGDGTATFQPNSSSGGYQLWEFGLTTGTALNVSNYVGQQSGTPDFRVDEGASGVTYLGTTEGFNFPAGRYKVVYKAISSFGNANLLNVFRFGTLGAGDANGSILKTVETNTAWDGGSRTPREYTFWIEATASVNGGPWNSTAGVRDPGDSIVEIYKLGS